MAAGPLGGWRAELIDVYVNVNLKSCHVSLRGG